MTEQLIAKGRNGQIVFDGKTVTITRDGIIARATLGKTDKQIAVRNITAVQFKPFSLLTPGYIQFTIPGEIAKNTRRGNQYSDVSKDENSVVFMKKDQPTFEAMRDAIQQAIANL